MDKNDKVQIIPISNDYREGFDKINWSDRAVDRVRIYDPFLDGPIEELLPKPVTIKHEGGAGPIEALAISSYFEDDRLTTETKPRG